MRLSAKIKYGIISFAEMPVCFGNKEYVIPNATVISYVFAGGDRMYITLEQLMLLASLIVAILALVDRYYYRAE